MLLSDLMLLLALIALGTTVGVVLAAAVFVRRQRQSLVHALELSGARNAETAQQLAAALSAMQQRQKQQEQQLQNIAQAALRLRQDVMMLAKQAEHDHGGGANADRMLH